MTHKKYQTIRLTSLACNTLIIGAVIVCIVLAILNDNIDKIIPIIIAIVCGIYLFIILFFGRIFCGFICPLGFFQDIIWKITEKLHLPKLSRNGKFMKAINILSKIFLMFFICVIVALTVILIFFPTILSKVNVPILAIAIVLPIVFISLNSFARRLFCNVCPIGSVAGFFGKTNIVKFEKQGKNCTKCGACYEACPMRIKTVYTETEKINVSNSKCLYCGECIKKCSNDGTLSLVVCGKKVYASSREDFLNNQFSDVTLNKKDKIK